MSDAQARDPLDPPVLHGLVAHPAIEDGHDGLPELVLGVLRKFFAHVLGVYGLVALDELYRIM